MVLVFMQQQKCFVQKSQNITLRTAHTQKVQNVYHYCEVLLFFSQQNNMYTSQHQYICYRKHSFKIRPHFQGSRRSSFQQKEKDEQKDTAFSCFEREAKTAAFPLHLHNCCRRGQNAATAAHATRHRDVSTAAARPAAKPRQRGLAHGWEW